MKSFERERIDKYFDKLYKENRELYWKLQCLCCCFIIARKANKNKVDADRQDDVITDQPKNESKNDVVNVDEILHEGAEQILEDVQEERRERGEKRRRSRRESRRKERRQDMLWG